MNGKQIAEAVASTVRAIVAELPDHKVVLYSSPKIRTVETAYQVSLQLNKIQILLNSGLAKEAAAVKKCIKKGKDYQFASLEEMRGICPDVDVQSCEDYIPAGSSSLALKAICQQSAEKTINVVVAHRETIRHLVGFKFRMPYCCTGIFKLMPYSCTSPAVVESETKPLHDEDKQLLTDSDSSDGAESFKLIRLLDPYNNTIDISDIR